MSIALSTNNPYFNMNPAPRNSEVTEDIFSSQHSEKWFESLIAQLKVDEMQLQTNTATEDKRAMYQMLISKNIEGLMDRMAKESHDFFISKLVVEFVGEIRSRKINASKIAFEMSESKVLAWIEVNDEDEASMNKIFNAEATVNVKNVNNGFSVETFIVESCDKLPVPPHYTILIG